MIELSLMQDDEEIPTGSIIRLYEVQRLDIMKSSADKKDINKKNRDFYEYMLVDCFAIKDNTFCLINITSDNNNRGSILWVLEEGSFNKAVKALQLKKYFMNDKVFIELNK